MEVINAKTTAFIIFSGFNQRAVIAFIRTLEANDVQYAIIASSANDTIFLTKYRAKVLAVRETISLDLNCLRSIKMAQANLRADKYIVAPSSEALNRFLLQNREIFAENQCEVPLVSQELYERVSDKYEFQKICGRSNLLVPEEYKDIADAGVTYVAKPKKYFASDGSVHNPILVFDNAQHNAFMRNFEQADFYYQEFIHGRSIYLLYYFHRDGSVYKFSQENHIQQSGGKSILAAKSANFHTEDRSLKYEKMFRDLNFYGLVMLEIREHKNQDYVIEANPRFWGPSQLFVDAGLNLFEAFLYDFNGIHRAPEFKEQVGSNRYFWFGGFAKESKEGITYHNYTPEGYNDELQYWHESDVYHREDTQELYKEELKL